MSITQRGVIIPQNEINVNIHELTLRLGMKNESDISFAKKNLEEVRETAHCRACFIRCDAEVSGERCRLSFATIKSRMLAKNLMGCSSAFVFAATLGADVDRLIMRKGAISAAEHFITDAAASAYMEAFADYVNTSLKAELVTKPRFSPGFGGFELDFQQKLLDSLNASRLIGLTLTESKMMVPTKSVTAVIGIME